MAKYTGLLRAYFSALLGFFLLSFSVSPSAQPVEPTAEQAAEQWLHYYYQDPQPQQFVQQVQQLALNGALTSEERRVPTQVFLAALLSQHSVLLDEWMGGLAELPQDVQENLQLALWRAETPAAKAWLKQHQQVEYAVGPPKLRGQPVHTALQVDMLWHRFYATGDWDLVRQLVSVLEQHRSNSLDALAAEQTLHTEEAEARYQQLQELALWSLGRHASSHPQVLEALGRMYSRGELSVRQQEALVPILESLAPGQYVVQDDITAQ